MTNQIGRLIASITAVHAQYQKMKKPRAAFSPYRCIGMTIANPSLLAGFKYCLEAARVAKTDPDVFLVLAQEV
ncbi:MAG TPA: hypothetical protein VMG82_01690 [Candidatus Sulfotelmatobacter sp.]|nr:hypothetical protein [Candidatus Sulfotelmatobacter sp.]